MACETGPNHPARRRPRDKVRELRRRLWAAAKRHPGRRFHALYDRIFRRDVLEEAWKRVKKNRGSAGVDAQTLAEVEKDDINPVLRGWGNYFRTGNAAQKFMQVDDYVRSRLRRFMVRRKGRNLRPGEAQRWTHDFFHHEHGLHRLRGTVKYPEAA